MENYLTEFSAVWAYNPYFECLCTNGRLSLPASEALQKGERGWTAFCNSTQRTNVLMVAEPGKDSGRYSSKFPGQYARAVHRKPRGRLLLRLPGPDQ
jgi:hypothetical protein